MWKEIIIIAVIVVIFIFFFSFMYSMFLKKTNREEKIVEGKKEDEKEDVKEDIPQILKEVTASNYMYDISKDVDKVDGMDIPENSDIAIPATESIKDAFDEIDDEFKEMDLLEDEIDAEIDEIDDIELDDDLDLTYITDAHDGVAGKQNKEENKIAKEYKVLSKEMKTILIANILERKDK